MAALADLHDLAQAFLDAATDALNLTPTGAPGRRFVSSGRPAFDCCGQLSVWVSALAPLTSQTRATLGALAPAKGPQRPVATIVIQATRCDATERRQGGTLSPPSTESLTAVAAETNADAWALWNHLEHALREGDLGEACTGAFRDGMTAIDSQGGCVGWELTYRVPLEGGLLGT